jgi:2-polyprenyl-3-methyl-5-hydroxy-6-metoxy-1,4-benzoquinol methylase
MLKQLVNNVGNNYIRRLTRVQAHRQSFRRSNERPVEYGFTFSWLNRLQPTTVLDVGTGKSALPALVRTCGFVVTAIDNVRDYWPKGMINRHWEVVDEDITKSRDGGQFDAVLCISVLEHIQDQAAAVLGLHARTRPGGHLILTTPFGEVGQSNAYLVPGSYGVKNPYPCRQHSPEDLRAWLATGFDLVHAEYWRAFDSDTWSVGEFVRPLEASDQPAQLGCFVLRRSK